MIYQMKITVPFIIIAFVLGVMLGYYFGYDSGFERAANKNVLKNTDTNTGFRIGENAIYVSEQKPSDIVVVDFVDVSGGGFVVIHESLTGSCVQVCSVQMTLSKGNVACPLRLSCTTKRTIAITIVKEQSTININNSFTFFFIRLTSNKKNLYLKMVV